jgi:hypothetical protein
LQHQDKAQRLQCQASRPQAQIALGSHGHDGQRRAQQQAEQQHHH